MYRHNSYKEDLAKLLNSSEENARIFLLTLMEGDDGMLPLEALKTTIRGMGVKEFSELSGIPLKSISRMLSSESLPKIETLNEYFAPFGLRVKIQLEKVA